MKWLLAMTAAAIVITPTAAHASRVPVDEGGDLAPCVTYAEFTVVNDAFLADTSLRRGYIRRVFDTDGTRTQVDPMADLGAAAAAGYEPVIPKHEKVRHYDGCVDAEDPNGADVFVVFNSRRDRAVLVRWM